MLKYATTTSVYDQQFDLSILGILNYNDKGFFDVPWRQKGAIMDKDPRGHKLQVKGIIVNLRIT